MQDLTPVQPPPAESRYTFNSLKEIFVEHLNVWKRIQSYFGPKEPDQLLSDHPFKANLQAPDAPRGKVITMKFKDAYGRVFCKERAIRVDTVDIYKHELQAKAKYLKGRLKEVEKGSPEEKKLTKLLNQAQQSLKLHQNQKATWASNDAPRRAYKLLGREEAQNKYLPALGNLRVHKILIKKGKDPKTVSSYHETNPAESQVKVTIEELQDYHVYQSYIKRKEGLTRLQPHSEAAGQKLIEEGIQALAKKYGVDQTQSFMDRLKNKLKIETGLATIMGDIEKRAKETYGEEAVNHLEELLKAERDIFKAELLRDLESYIKAEKPQEKEIFYGKIGGLNPRKSFYKEIDGVEIIFDPRTRQAYFDDRGKIHVHGEKAEVKVLKMTNKRVEMKEISSINRSAATTDFSHGEVSLEELKDYEDLKRIHRLSDTGHQTQQAGLNLLRSRQLEFERKYGFKDRQGLSIFIEDLEKRIQTSYGPNAIDRVDEIIDRRREILRSQILQDLYTHIQERPPMAEEIVYARVGLLDTQKDPSVNEEGLVLHEQTHALDTRAIYNELDGVEVIFDPKAEGPFFDEKGNIHMPSDREGSKQLKTLFFNVSVQRHTDNVGLQKFLNEEALEKFRILRDQNKLTTEQETKLKLLEASISNNSLGGFERADMAIDLVNTYCDYTSVNCFGGKDRTGYSMATHTYRIIEEEILRPNEVGEEKANLTTENNRLLKKIAHQLLSKKGIAIQIVKDNTGHTVLKIGPWNLELYRVKTISGAASRVFSYAELVKTKGTGQGESPDQLYYEAPPSLHDDVQ